MSKKFFSGLTIVAVVFTLVLGLGTFNTAKAVPGENGEGYTLASGTTNLFGADLADNPIGLLDADRDSTAYQFAPDSYGLWGTSQE